MTWNSYKQKSTALSLTEAEYIAIADCVRKISIVRRVLKELGLSISETPTKVFEDNLSCVSWVLSAG